MRFEPSTILSQRAWRGKLSVYLFCAIALLAALGVSAQAQSTVTFAWDPSTGQVAGYRIYQGTAPGTYSQKIECGPATSKAISGLTIGTRYYFAVVAYDEAGLESDFSNEVQYTPASVGTPAIVLSSPANGASFDAPASISMAASVTANGQTISKVQFFNGSTLLGEDSSAPYSFAWNNVAAGIYSLKARALYGTSGSVDSQTASVAVAASRPPSGLTFAATSGTITSPFIVSGDSIYQTTLTGVTDGGRAVYTFAVPTAGDYVIEAEVVAPNSSANSFFVNIDGEPTDPEMIWDIPPASTATTRRVSWRGTGPADANQYSEKVFTLSAGTHQLVVRGREPNTLLGTINIVPLTSNGLTFASTSGNISAPFTSSGGMIYQTSSTGVANGGRATYNFTVTAPGNYVVKADVLAANSSQNSFYVNIDGEPVDPTMIWDIPPSSATANRTVSWRGTGPADANQYNQQVFTLSAGTHQLVVRGREPYARLGTITIEQVAGSSAPAIVLSSPSGGATYTAPASISLAASVTPNGQTISKVQFFNGATLLGEDASAPYTFAWNNVGSGTYSLKARALYGAGSSVDSQAQYVTVSDSQPPPSSDISFAATSGAITGPFVSSGGMIYQGSATTLAGGGRAVYTFTVSTPGDYIVKANVLAPTGNENSFYLNIDSEPTDPETIWDIPPGSSAVTHTVTWRGTDAADANRYNAKVFTLAAGEHQLIVRGREANTRLDEITIAPAPFVPAPWRVANIGQPGVAGSASATTSTGYAVSGAGNLSGSSDNLAFMWQPLSGDGQIVARITSTTDTGSNARAGVMIRESLTTGSRYVFLGISPDGTIRWQRRTSTGSSTSATTSVVAAPPNCWVRLVRTGSTIVASRSADGVNWVQVGSGSVSMASSIYIGVPVASGSTTALNTSEFNNVSVVP